MCQILCPIHFRQIICTNAFLRLFQNFVISKLFDSRNIFILFFLIRLLSYFHAVKCNIASVISIFRFYWNSTIECRFLSCSNMTFRLVVIEYSCICFIPYSHQFIYIVYPVIISAIIPNIV
ncbi:hypothetical protein EUBVEN_00144 [Eubacterium ventriosum ATCC 27560]|uniref:Uncharacterized protein n=1 Tax=Eubacterium ventriosum ATCC 27560 TaxID=411463 RepID=A5Z399_9FIRM|nr:hypothetical protein EUBVEN_00144 [Eubacterium ventriosum ATCC 27560]